MARYILKPSTESVYFIRYQGRMVGEVRRRPTNTREWFGKIGPIVEYGPTANAAFHAVVAHRNRLDLCGENDPAKARAALDKRNAEIERRNREIEASPLFEISRLLGSRTGRRRTRRRILI